MAGPTREFWEQRFAEGSTPWDRGEANPQLSAWLAAGALKPCRIQIPGCGSGYEVAALAEAGFEVTGLDYAPVAISRRAESEPLYSVRSSSLAFFTLTPSESAPGSARPGLLRDSPWRRAPGASEL